MIRSINQLIKKLPCIVLVWVMVSCASGGSGGGGGSSDAASTPEGHETPTVTLNSIYISPQPAGGQKLAVSSTDDTQFSAVAVYSDNTEQTLTEKVVWSINDPTKKALLNRFTGKFSPYDSTSDTITIRIEYNDHSDEITAEIVTLTPQSIELVIYKDTIPDEDETRDSLEIIEGESAKLAAIATYDNNGDISTRNITTSVDWKFTDANSLNYAQILWDGTIITEGKNGAVDEILIDIEDVPTNSGNPIDPVKLKISEKLLVSIAIKDPPTDVVKGSQFEMYATGTFNDGTIVTQDDLTVRWESSNENILQFATNSSTAEIQQVDGTADVLLYIHPDGNSDCAADCLSASHTITVHNQTLSSIEILSTGISKPLADSSVIDLNFSNDVPVGISAYLTIIGHYDSGPVSRMDLSKDNNLLFIPSGSGISVCGNEKNTISAQCWFEITDGSATGSLTVQYDGTDISSDINITGGPETLINFELMYYNEPRTSLTLLNGESKQLELRKITSLGYQADENADSASGITWTYSLDGSGYLDSSDILSVDDSGVINAVQAGTVYVKGSMADAYAGTVSQVLEVEVLQSVIELNSYYNGKIDKLDEIHLTFDFPSTDDYTFTFVSEKKTNLSEFSPGSTWFFIVGDNSYDCELSHNQPRVSINLEAGTHTFGFDNLDVDEGYEETVFSLVISRGSGYECNW